jgi:hypothetical protein
MNEYMYGTAGVDGSIHLVEGRGLEMQQVKWFFYCQ